MRMTIIMKSRAIIKMIHVDDDDDDNDDEFDDMNDWLSDSLEKKNNPSLPLTYSLTPIAQNLQCISACYYIGTPQVSNSK